MILILSAKLPDTPEGRAVRYQISKSVPSVGANYREANRAKSKADFINKIRIAEGEACENVYWLEVIQDMNWLADDDLLPALKEGNELLAIFTSIHDSATRR